MKKLFVFSLAFFLAAVSAFCTSTPSGDPCTDTLLVVPTITDAVVTARCTDPRQTLHQTSLGNQFTCLCPVTLGPTPPTP